MRNGKLVNSENATLVLAPCPFLRTSPAQNAVQVSNYLFQGNLNPQRGGSAVLTATNPSGNSGFVTDTVFGQARTVYAVAGAASPAPPRAGSLTRRKTRSRATAIPWSSSSPSTPAPPAGGEFSIARILRAPKAYTWTSGFITYFSGVSSSALDRLVAGTYYHVVLVKRPGEVLVYLNGRLVASRNPTDLGVMAAALSRTNSSVSF